MNTPVLTVKGLTKSYQPSWISRLRGAAPFVAVNNLSFSLAPGEVLGLLGPNGAGKTTITQMLLGTLTPTSGEIEFFGKNLFTHRSEILRSISFASSYVQLASRLTIYENLDLFGRLYGLAPVDRAEQIEKFLKFFSMWELRNRETGSLSAGQNTRIMLAKAFLSRPKVLLLDEPTASLDPDVAQETLQFVQEQQKQYGVSLLFTSHNMEEMVTLCDRVLVLQNGEIIANDSPRLLAATVSTARIELIMSDENLQKSSIYAQQQLLEHTVEKNCITFFIDEQRVASTLSALGTAGISYDQISIEKPTLKNYFLHIAQQSRKRSR